MKLIPCLLAVASLATLASPAQAQAFTDPLQVTLAGTYSVTRSATGNNFNAITLNGTNQTNVALTWATAPAFTVVSTNAAGWSATLRGPATGVLTGPAGAAPNTIPINYRFGTGTITPVGASTVINGGVDSNVSGTLATGAKTVSAPTTALGSWTYRVGSFISSSIPANQRPGTYGGAALLTTTFTNTP
ncbi:hypothetical protein IV102_26910 [bacterium]|nr:hypothetical protein [bacterium]